MSFAASTSRAGGGINSSGGVGDLHRYDSCSSLLGRANCVKVAFPQRNLWEVRVNELVVVCEILKELTRNIKFALWRLIPGLSAGSLLDDIHRSTYLLSSRVPSATGIFICLAWECV